MPHSSYISRSENILVYQIFFAHIKKLNHNNENRFNVGSFGSFGICLYISTIEKTNSSSILHCQKLPQLCKIIQLQFWNQSKPSCMHCNVSSSRLLRFLHKKKQGNTLLNQKNEKIAKNDWNFKYHIKCLATVKFHLFTLQIEPLFVPYSPFI